MASCRKHIQLEDPGRKAQLWQVSRRMEFSIASVRKLFPEAPFYLMSDGGPSPLGNFGGKFLQRCNLHVWVLLKDGPMMILWIQHDLILDVESRPSTSARWQVLAGQFWRPKTLWLFWWWRAQGTDFVTQVWRSGYEVECLGLSCGAERCWTGLELQWGVVRHRKRI